VTEELGELELDPKSIKDQRWILVQKYGLAQPVFDRFMGAYTLKMTKPEWMEDEEWIQKNKDQKEFTKAVNEVGKKFKREFLERLNQNRKSSQPLPRTNQSGKRNFGHSGPRTSQSNMTSSSNAVTKQTGSTNPKQGANIVGTGILRHIR